MPWRVDLTITPARRGARRRAPRSGSARRRRRPRCDRRRCSCCSDCGDADFKIDSGLGWYRRRAVVLHAIRRRRSRLRLISDRRRGRGRGGGRRPRIRDRAVPRRRPPGDGVRIVRVVETHTHADHLSGHGRLASSTASRSAIHPPREAAYQHDPLEDGDGDRARQRRLRCIHTPGTGPSTAAFRRRRRADEPGSSSPATRSSSGTPPGPTSR